MFVPQLVYRPFTRL